MKKLFILTSLLFTLFGCSNNTVVGDLGKYDLYGPVKSATIVTDEDSSHTIELEFDSSGKHIELVDDVEKEYDQYGRLSREIDPYIGELLIFEYDSHGRVVKIITDFYGDKESHIFKYDKKGTVIKQQNPDGSYVLFSEHVLDQFNNWTQRKFRIFEDEKVLEEGIEKREIEYYP